jgi:hypothetical protein
MIFFLLNYRYLGTNCGLYRNLIGDENMKRNYLILTFLIVVFICLLQFGCKKQAVAAEGPKPTIPEPNLETDSVEAESATASAKGPEITFDKQVCHIGRIKPGSTSICEFKFTNTGDSLLTITEVTKTCGCTPYELAKMEYAPGESGILKVEYHAGRQSASIHKSLFVSSNDKTKPRIELVIIGDIVENFEYEPKKLELVLNKENAGCPAITIRSTERKLFSIKQFKATGRSKSTEDFITADFNSTVKATEFVLQPKVDVEKLRNEHGGSIEIVVSRPERDRITIPFDVLPRFKVNPPSLIIFNAEPQKPVTREVWILSNYNEDFEVESTSTQEGAIKVLSQEKIENRYKFELEITPPAAEKGRIGFFTDVFFVNIKGGEQLKIACRVFYPKKTEKSSQNDG